MRGEVPRRRDSDASRSTGSADAGRHASAVRADSQRDTDRPERHLADAPNDGRRDRDDPERDPIDPRLLAGVPRPHAALPDDTGRAYLTQPRDTRPPPDRDTKPDLTRPPEPPPDPKDRRPLADHADRLRVWVDRPAFQDGFDDIRPPDRYGDPLTLQDGTRVPRFNDRPTRDQTRQGRLGDCGVMATLGAVASHRPGDIAHRVAIEADGTYRVRLNEAKCTRDGARSTGRVIELSVTPELPVDNNAPGQPAFAKAEDGAAWSPVLEKAFAGVDKTWTASRRADWAESWAALCETDAADKDVKNPRSGPPPDGYVRLNQGSSAWERAEILTQLTGKESIVRSVPRRPDDLTRVLAKQLDDRKPVLIASRPERYKDERLPHGLQAAHAYEVVGVSAKEIALRNPWKEDHPELMSPAEFIANMEPRYTTLK